MSGKVSFSIFLVISISKRFDKTWGDQKSTQLTAINILPLVQEALEKPLAWETELPEERHLLVALKENTNVVNDSAGNPVLDDSGNQYLLISPMGTLTIKQEILPLNVKLDQYQNQKISDSNKVIFNSITLGGIPYDGNDLTDVETDFAPSQYFDYTEKEKLKKNSFELMDNGKRLTAETDLSITHFVRLDYNYDITLSDGPPEPDHVYDWRRWRKWTLDTGDNFISTDRLVKGGLIRENAQSTGNRHRGEATVGKSAISRDQFAVVNKNTLEIEVIDDKELVGRSISAAEDLMRDAWYTNPDLEDELMVVNRLELVN